MSRPSRDSLHRDRRITELEDALAQTHLRMVGRDAVLALIFSPETDPEQRDTLLSQLPAIYAEIDRKIAADYAEPLKEKTP